MLVLAFFHFTSLDQPHKEVKEHKNFLLGKDVLGRLYISEMGLNGQMSGKKEDIEAYIAWLKERYGIPFFNVDPHHEHAFPRLCIKYRKQLVALDQEANPHKGGVHLSPQAWKEMLEKEENRVIVDVRNDYESKIGHFEGAILPSVEQFRDFPAFAKELKERVGEKTKVMVYCTGGIRCELYSALLKEEGMEEVFQLQGGVIHYGHVVGSDHWKGKLFVFDDRMAVAIDGKEKSPISSCSHCQEALSDTYYNCANMDCNNLFLSCLPCLDNLKGCCSETCSKSSRLRAYLREGNKPFRRKHLSILQ